MENVNHPSHYNQNGRKECIDEIIDLFGIEYAQVFCLTNAYKYLYRAGNKEGNSAMQDMLKCKWYLEWTKKHGADTEKYEWLYNKCDLWFDNFIDY